MEIKQLDILGRKGKSIITKQFTKANVRKSAEPYFTIYFTTRKYLFGAYCVLGQ